MENNKIQGTATGYVWWSDASLPQVYIAEPIDLDLSAPGIPFVAEANLVINQKSYSVKMVDGAYRVAVSSLEPSEEVVFTDVEYFPNRLTQVRPEVQRLKFRKYWREEADPLCENMPVLVPAEEVFVGFVLQGKENKLC
jgi:CRISPR type III-associated protein (TIGR04423 family)